MPKESPRSCASWSYLVKFDLEQLLVLVFGCNAIFSKFRIEHVMLKFRATTESTKKMRSEESNYNRGKVVQK